MTISSLRRIPVLLVALLLLPAGPTTLAAPLHAPRSALVGVSRVGSLGRILVTGKGFALYRWTREKINQIRCTGQCARAWPPLLVPASTSIPRSIPGASGRFGIIVRPDGARQLSYNGHALYRYVSDTRPGEALCQGAEGWYVIRVG
jgi:predicted lipoprotein with Yx(FWY)xxD motif